MAKIKARFMFVNEASADGKSNVTRLRMFQLEDQDEVYAFPIASRDLQYHEELMKNPTARNAKKVLSTCNRYQRRNPLITLSEELREVYLDAEGNPAFRGDLLEEISEPQKEVKPVVETETIIQKPLTKERVKKSLSSIVKDAVIEKFNGRNFNASTWITTMETECERLEIPENRYCEVIRLFVEGSATDWYQANQIVVGTSSWQTWRTSFLNAFANKGWQNVCNAIYFRFGNGSVTDYALKKLNLLVDMDPKISENLKVCMIVSGLPAAVRERLDRDEIDSVNKLFCKLNLLDRAQRQYGPNNNNNNNNGNSNNSYKGMSNRYNNNNFNRGGQQKRTTCTYCEKKGFPGRLHPEVECRIKVYDNLKNGTLPNNNQNSSYAYAAKTSTTSNFKPTKLVNTTELEELIANESNQKN
jgi:hypothetical protein